MARIRTIKPEFFTSLTVADLTPEQRLTFIGLWTHCDDKGRAVDDARLVKAAVWPLDDRTAADVETDLAALSERSLITRYTVNRKPYMAVTNWVEHQKINRPSKNALPGPEQADSAPAPPPTRGNDDSPNTHAPLTEDSPQERNREQGKEQGTGNTTAPAPRPPDDAPRDDVERLCQHLADRIEQNGSRRPTITKAWRTAARLMLDRDGRTEEQAHAAIDWCQDSEFWRSNVLSMPKLRDKYDTMRLQAARPAGNVVALRPGGQQQTDDLFDRAMARAAAREQGAAL